MKTSGTSETSATLAASQKRNEEAGTSEKPLIFVSHKTSDEKVATVISEFIRRESRERVGVFQSSNPQFKGTEPGKPLNEDLRKALADTESIILLYTCPEEDWSYCIWECGVATNPKSEPTKLYVLECCGEVPKPFQHIVRIDMRRQNDVLKFVQDLFTKTIPGLDEPLIPLAETHEDVKKIADGLFEKLQTVIPPLEQTPIRSWSSWPFLRVRVPREAQLSGGTEETFATSTQPAEFVRQEGSVVASDRADSVFGRTIEQGQSLGDLVDAWESAYPGVSPRWFETLARQMQAAANEQFLSTMGSALRDVGGSGRRLPTLTHTRSIPAAQAIEFDIYLCAPPTIPVKSVMIPLDEIYSKSMSEAGTRRVLDLLDELDRLDKSRVPFLGANREIKGILHRSMIDRFVAQKLRDRANDVRELTMADLFAESELKEVFESTFEIVPKRASLEEARQAMQAREGCQDVFVTETGQPQEPVLGWVTNVTVVGLSSGQTTAAEVPRGAAPERPLRPVSPTGAVSGPRPS